MPFLPLIFFFLIWPEVKSNMNSQELTKRTCDREKSFQEPSSILNNTRDRLVYPSVAKWVTDQSFDDIILYPNENVDLPPTTRNVWSSADMDMTSGQCAEECMKEDWCSSFFVDFSKHLCILHEVVFLTPDTSGLMLSVSGARYFRQVDRFCHFSKGLYRWRDEELCFKLLPPGTVEQASVTAVQTYCRHSLGGSLLKIETTHRANWIRKILLQWQSKSSQSVAVDFVKSGSSGEIPEKFWCPQRSSHKILIPAAITVLSKACGFKAVYGDYDNTLYFLCETF